MDIQRKTAVDPIRVLFVCTGNSARSILCEAALRAWGGGRFLAYSAGSRPVGRVNPAALSVLRDEGIPVDGLCSKSWGHFTKPDSPRLDIVITVCDSAASESCPVLFGNFLRVHWGLPDPASARGNEHIRRAAFQRAFGVISQRIRMMTSLPLELLPRSQWHERLQAIAYVQAKQQI